MIEYQVKVYNDRVEWYLNNKLHREDGPAIEYSDGSKVWYKDGLRHREGGPAMEYADGSKAWYKEGRCHREDGPAVSDPDCLQWWINGRQYTEQEFRDYRNRNIYVYQQNKPCAGKKVIVDGIEYELR